MQTDKIYTHTTPEAFFPDFGALKLVSGGYESYPTEHPLTFY